MSSCMHVSGTVHCYVYCRAREYRKSGKLCGNYFRVFFFTRNLIFMVVIVSTISASARVTVLTIFHVFNYGSGQLQIIPIQRKFPELWYLLLHRLLLQVNYCHCTQLKTLSVPAALTPCNHNNLHMALKPMQ